MTEFLYEMLQMLLYEILGVYDVNFVKEKLSVLDRRVLGRIELREI